MRRWLPRGLSRGNPEVAQSPMALAHFAQATDNVVHRGDCPLGDRRVAGVSADSAQSSLFTRSPGRHTRCGSRSRASGDAFYRLRDVEASQARHYVPSQWQFWTAIRAGDSEAIQARPAVRQGRQSAMGRRTLLLEVQSRPTLILIQDHCQTGHRQRCQAVYSLWLKPCSAEPDAGRRAWSALRRPTREEPPFGAARWWR
jgi:hypothetical protein